MRLLSFTVRFFFFLDSCTWFFPSRYFLCRTM